VAAALQPGQVGEAGQRRVPPTYLWRRSSGKSVPEFIPAAPSPARPREQTKSPRAAPCRPRAVPSPVGRGHAASLPRRAAGTAPWLPVPPPGGPGAVSPGVGAGRGFSAIPVGDRVVSGPRGWLGRPRGAAGKGSEGAAEAA